MTIAAERSPSPARGRPRALMAGAITALLCLCACSSNVVLRRAPGADTGALRALQRCNVGEAQCSPDPNPDTSRFDDSHTAYFSLPACPFGIEQIVVKDVGTSNAFADVQCAAPPPPPPSPDGGIPTTATGGGVR